MPDILWAEAADIPASDRGLAYGDGLFETIRVFNGQPSLLLRHLDRLREGARRLGIPLQGVDLGRLVSEACQRYAREPDWVLKIMLTRGSGGRGYAPPSSARPRLILDAHPVPDKPDSAGVTACMSSVTLAVNPVLAGMKSLARIEQVLASQSIRPGCYEALMTDPCGRLLEGTRTNLLLRLGDRWLTPPASGLAVAGIMRAKVMDALGRAGEAVREGHLLPAMLASRDCGGLWLMNSVIGVVPVRSVGCVRLPVAPRLATIDPQSLFTE
ncbi:aminodeoxychorismate lyase [Marinobacter sp.]|uniref:aminodeoxychorismate lyase n=1 Tax=Marinobacter sp. TaxID=50741 RepID=UPI00384AB9D4